MKIKLLLAAVCCAALSGAYAQSPSPTDTADTGASPSATTSKETKTKRSKKRTQKTGTEDVTGSTGPSTGGVPQTNSTHGSSTIGTGTQATVGTTSNTNPNASTGNMNPQGSATGQGNTKKSHKETSRDVTGSTGPSTGGVPQTNSTHGSSTIGTGTQATVGSTSNTNPNASTGNMNPQGSATGQGNTKKSHKETSRDVTGSGGPSTGGVPQTNSTYGSSTIGTGTQATVGNTSNTNPKASTGNMNPQGSATGQSSTHRR